MPMYVRLHCNRLITVQDTEDSKVRHFRHHETKPQSPKYQLSYTIITIGALLTL